VFFLCFFCIFSCKINEFKKKCYIQIKL
jgi:hypothetical protein